MLNILGFHCKIWYFTLVYFDPSRDFPKVDPIKRLAPESEYQLI